MVVKRDERGASDAAWLSVCGWATMISARARHYRRQEDSP
jgi:hypothetical protein